MHLTLLFVLCYFTVVYDHAGGMHTRHIRIPRQISGFFGPSLSLPIVSQIFSQVPSPTSTIQDQCFLLMGLSPTGCAYIPNIVNPLTNQLSSCRLECSDQVAPLQLTSPLLGTFSAVLPDYLVSNTFQISDQSNMDNFTGEAYGVIYPPTTTTSTTTTTLKPVTTTTKPKPVIPPAVGNVASCICSPDFGAPPPRCTWVGQGSGSPLTCTFFCGCGPFDPSCAAKNFELCLVQKGPPSPGCSYSGLGSGDGSTLTCPEVCVTQCP